MCIYNRRWRKWHRKPPFTQQQVYSMCRCSFKMHKLMIWKLQQLFNRDPCIKLLWTSQSSCLWVLVQIDILDRDWRYLSLFSKSHGAGCHGNTSSSVPVMLLENFKEPVLGYFNPYIAAWSNLTCMASTGEISLFLWCLIFLPLSIFLSLSLSVRKLSQNKLCNQKKAEMIV